MTPLARDFADARRTRDAARSTFDSRLAQVRADLEARGVGGRIADKVGEEARIVLDEGLAIAAESKGIIAGMVAATSVWLLRHPIMNWIGSALEPAPLDDEDELEDEFDD